MWNVIKWVGLALAYPFIIFAGFLVLAPIYVVRVILPEVLGFLSEVASIFTPTKK